MHLSKIRIFNYKSYEDSGEVSLSPGFNVVIGRNNAGKTAFAECLGLSSRDTPHRSPKTVPMRGDSPQEHSRVDASIVVSRQEVLRHLARLGWRITIPADPNRHMQEQVAAFVESLSAPSPKTLQVRRADGQTTGTAFEGDGNLVEAQSLSFQVTRDDTGLKLASGISGPVSSADPANYYRTHLARYCADRIYTFRAERLVIGPHAVGDSDTLTPDAGNLAQVLDRLQNGNPPIWQRLERAVKTVFPELQAITVPVRGVDAHIHLWFDHLDNARDDLAIPLVDSGSGVGQVLAMLYVVVTSDEPRIIVIDEPQSFLHPGAVRRLLGILREHPLHQYVMTTHSPVALASLEISNLIEARRDGMASVLRTVGVQDATELQSMLGRLGVRLSDVFGADNVLWVEGPTEETCYRLLVERILKRPLLGTVILGVLDVDGLIGRGADRILTIYSKLSQSGVALPPAVGLLFDREDRTQAVTEQLSKRCGGRVAFIDRRMYENYLLNVEAIQHVLNKVEGAEVTVEMVSAWLKEKRKDQKYTRGNDGQIDGEWIDTVDGAKLLADLFGALTEQRLVYDKGQAWPVLDGVVDCERAGGFGWGL